MAEVIMLYDSKNYIDGIDKVCEANVAVLNELAGSRILVTGAGGQIGSAIVDMLLHSAKKIHVYAAGRNEKKIYERFSIYLNHPCFTFVRYDALDVNPILPDIDYIICGAGNSSPDQIGRFPVETMQANLIGLTGLLEHMRKGHAKKLLYISSSEVYGKVQTPEPIKENGYGLTDILKPRSSYAEGKRACETLAASYLEEYGVQVVVARPGHIYGPTMKADDQHIVSVLARKAAAGEKLVLKSDGRQKRSYLYALDAAAALVTVLIRGTAGEAYNIADCDSGITIREIAEKFAAYGGVELEYAKAAEEEMKVFNPMENSCLNGEKLRELGWKSVFKIEDGVRGMMK